MDPASLDLLQRLSEKFDSEIHHLAAQSKSSTAIAIVSIVVSGLVALVTPIVVHFFTTRREQRQHRRVEIQRLRDFQRLKYEKAFQLVAETFELTMKSNTFSKGIFDELKSGNPTATPKEIAEVLGDGTASFKRLLEVRMILLTFHEDLERQFVPLKFRLEKYYSRLLNAFEGAGQTIRGNKPQEDLDSEVAGVLRKFDETVNAFNRLQDHIITRLQALAVETTS